MGMPELFSIDIYLRSYSPSHFPLKKILAFSLAAYAMIDRKANISKVDSNCDGNLSKSP